MALEEYEIKAISNKEATAVVIEHHYLHRKAPCSFAFGLFKGDTIVGVIIYGTPSSATLRSGIAGVANKDNVIELTRLWVDDSVPKNGESFLIGNTLSLINKEIVVSYAEIQQGHIGVVYQATNWLYTGLSAKRTDWVIEGIDKHSQTLADKYTSKEIREIYGDKFSLKPRPRKHRYVYLNCNKYRKKQLMKELKYAIMPYPKRIITSAVEAE
jgi:hypothetical protein